MDSKGFTPVELIILAVLCGIGAVFLVGLASGNSPIQTKQSCLSAGGQWSEGIQHGRVTKLCTYN